MSVELSINALWCYSRVIGVSTEQLAICQLAQFASLRLCSSVGLRCGSPLLRRLLASYVTRSLASLRHLFIFRTISPIWMFEASNSSQNVLLTENLG
jgi:hypothetical protein